MWDSFQQTPSSTGRSEVRVSHSWQAGREDARAWGSSILVMDSFTKVVMVKVLRTEVKIASVVATCTCSFFFIFPLKCYLNLIEFLESCQN